MNLIAAPPPDEPDPSDLADALEEIHRRQAAGEPVDLAEFRARLGPRYAELDEVLTAEAMLDEALGDELPGPLELPRPFGPYTLVREVGRGGAGVVYEAVERALGRTVALKVLRLSLEDDAQALARFQREASACARVRHDCIVAVHGHGVFEGRACYAMDLVKGAPLSRLISEKRLPPRGELARALAGVADALQALHAAGTVHRDVKPANLLMREDGRLVLADFGLARTPEAATLTRTGAMVGTPAYMSPEQVLGRQDAIDARSDVYGLGAVLYECLAGRVPFLTDAWPQLVSLIVAQRPVPPGVHGHDVPAPLARIALKALEKDPADRYATAAAMADDLRAFAEGREVLGRPVPRLVRAARWARRRWVPLAAAGVVVVGVGAWWTTRPATLTIPWTLPADAQVWIDGQNHGTAPVAVRLGAGRHRVELRREGLEVLVKDVELSPAAEREVLMPPLRPDPGATPRQQLAWLLGLARDARLDTSRIALREASGVRAPPRGSPSVRVLAPRGTVRPQDLGRWWVEVDPEAYRPGGRLELRRGAEVLAQAALNPTEQQTFGRFELGASTLASLTPGTGLTVAFVPSAEAAAGGADEGAPAEQASLTVVAAEAAAEPLLRLEALLPGERGAEWRLLRALALLEADLATAALAELGAAAAERGCPALAGSLVGHCLDRLELSRTWAAEDLEGGEGTGTLPAWLDRISGPPASADRPR